MLIGAMKLFFGMKIMLILVIFIHCCLFFGANCDSLLQENTGDQVLVRAKFLRVNKSKPAYKLGRSPSIEEKSYDIPGGEDKPVLVNDISVQVSRQDDGQIGTGERVEPTNRQTIVFKRSAQSASPSRRKQPKIHLAQRPRGSAVKIPATATTTTSTTTSTTPDSSDTETTSKGDSESTPQEDAEDSGEYEEIEDENLAATKPTTTEAATDEDTTSKVSTKSPILKESKTSNGKPAKLSISEPQKFSKSKPDTKANQAKSRASVAQTNQTIGDDYSPTTITSAKQNKKPLMALPFIKPKNSSVCIPEAYLEFPRDLVGSKWRGRGLILIHIAVVCYMFYSLALVCERYFMPSLEEFAQRLQLSEDVAGATLMSAGSSAPELFTAILGVFIAKGDIGTGTIVGSAVFNILFVIGVCAFVSTTTAQLNWWPVLRDSVFYSFTVLVLILCIYDERVTAFESFAMLALYGVYILIMVNNESIKECVTRNLLAYPLTANLISSAMSADGPDDVFGSSPGASSNLRGSSSDKRGFFSGGGGQSAGNKNYQTTSMIAQQSSQRTVEEDSMFLAACLIIVRHKRLFKSQLRFQSAARYIIIKRQHKIQQHQQQLKQQHKSTTQSNEVNYFGPENEPLNNNQRDRMEAYANSASMSKNKFSIVSKDDYEFWNRPPENDENYYLWLAKIPVNYVLHYTVPDCSLHPDKYMLTFVVSILWTAVFSYIMVWMVTLIGYTLGIPDSVMGATFLAAGTSVPDCYSSIHAARNGMADMAVSNSIGSNVFDILVGLSLPWFIQTAIYPGVVATINSRGVIYSVVLLFLSLIVTIYLLNKYEWTLKPRLGLALLIAYGLFIILSCMLEFNIFGHVNPPACPVD